MSDTNNLRTRIADELNRTDLSSQIQREINSAIQHYQTQRFPWNEKRDVFLFTTTPSTRYYSFTHDVVDFDTLKGVYSGSYININHRNWSSLEYADGQETASEGIPTEFTVYGKQIRLYPVPSVTLTVLGSYIYRSLLTSLTGSYCASTTITPTTTTSHNNRRDGWTTEGEALIRARAVAAVRINYLRDAQALAEHGILASGGETFLSNREKSAYRALAGLTEKLKSTGEIKPYYI